MQLDPVASGLGPTNKTMARQDRRREHGHYETALPKRIKRLVPDDPTFQHLIARTEGTDVFKRQKLASTKMRDLLAMSAQTPRTFLRPLSGLLDLMFGEKGLSMALPRAVALTGLSNKSILAYADKIQERPKGLRYKLFEAIGKQQGGSQLDSYQPACWPKPKPRNRGKLWHGHRPQPLRETCS